MPSTFDEAREHIGGEAGGLPDHRLLAHGALDDDSGRALRQRAFETVREPFERAS